jgi:hypothetical protein
MVIVCVMLSMSTYYPIIATPSINVVLRVLEKSFSSTFQLPHYLRSDSRTDVDEAADNQGDAPAIPDTKHLKVRRAVDDPEQQPTKRHATCLRA